MPRNGSGVYSLPAGSTVTNGDTSDATDLNTPLADLVTDANTARPIVAGGTGATSAADALTNLGLTATAAELNTLDGITATVAELNILDGVTATAAEINALDGVTWTLTDYNTLTATATELNQLDGVTLGGLASVDILDEDDFASDSATRPPSQQSTKAYVDGQDVGVGQAWQNVTGSRTNGTSYQNTTGKPIMVQITTNDAGTIQASVNGSTWVTIAETSSSRDNTSFVVPDDHYYRTQSVSAIDVWAELR